MDIVRTRVSAVIVKEKKLLVVKGDFGIYRQFYFTPGGGVEVGETDIEALKREMWEELKIRKFVADKYFSYVAKLQNSEDYQRVNCYLVRLEEEINLAGEITKMFWYDKDNFLSKTPELSISTYDYLLPKLVEDELI